jgi:hypothetical protein
VERQTGFLGDHQGDRRVGAGADILRSGQAAGRAVLNQFDGSFGGGAGCDPGTGSHTPAERHAIALHGTDARRALAPAELLSAGGQAFRKMPRGEGLAGALILLGLIHQAQLNGIDLELKREFIHRRFERE